MNISHQGIGTDGGLTFSLHPDLRVNAGQQMNFEYFFRLAARTTVQGQVTVCGSNTRPVGVFVDCSPKGDTATVETEGFEWVEYDTNRETPLVGSWVTTYDNNNDGKVWLIEDGNVTNVVSATPGEIAVGIFQVDQVDTVNNRVLICLGS